MNVKFIGRTLVATAIALTSSAAFGSDSLMINNTPGLKWQIQGDGKVWLMNLDQINSSWLCCYKYYIDLNTAAGRGMWGTFLSYIAQGTPMYVVVADKTQLGPVTSVGNIF